MFQCFLFVMHLKNVNFVMRVVCVYVLLLYFFMRYFNVYLV